VDYFVQSSVQQDAKVVVRASSVDPLILNSTVIFFENWSTIAKVIVKMKFIFLRHGN